MDYLAHNLVTFCIFYPGFSCLDSIFFLVMAIFSSLGMETSFCSLGMGISFGKVMGFCVLGLVTYVLGWETCVSVMVTYVLGLVFYVWETVSASSSWEMVTYVFYLMREYIKLNEYQLNLEYKFKGKACYGIRGIPVMTICNE